ncbi:glycosyltransferase [Microbacterium sp. CCNWLW134]|uniref:glycosyltransferase n=1 Tax=Microbacterium sp. CCNWLW134 TaxID=3122064 RepID=UPI00300F88FF
MPLVLGQPSLFSFSDADDVPDDLSLRERRLLVGALNFHALMAPSRELTVHAYDGSWETLPRTTDDATFTGLSRAFRRRLFSLVMKSEIEAEERQPQPGEAVATSLAERPVRHIHISRDDVLAHDPPRDRSPNPIRRVLRDVRLRAPLLYDEARDLELLRHRSHMRRAPRRQFHREFDPGGVHEEFSIIPAPAPPDGASRAVIIGIHWFEMGGAERWAFETIRLVREAGLLPIVLSNRESHHPWLARPELDGALLIPFSEPTARSQTPGVEQLLRGILRSFDVRGVVVHHNQWLYDRLHWISDSRPDIPIVDSTHILEFRGGGYPMSSALVEEVITTHHVISPALERWMTQTQGIAGGKVVMAPLVGLTVTDRSEDFRRRDEADPFTVAFVGRMARQKAPEVFVAMAHRLRRAGVRARFIMHGDGDMAAAIDHFIRALGLEGTIERRTSGVPVVETLSDAHLLVIPSHNEGLTLTTLEAIAHGVPVVSTDVGAQSDVVPPRALTSRNAHRAVGQLAAKVTWLARDEQARYDLWRSEREAENALLSHPSATEWFTNEVAAW